MKTIMRHTIEIAGGLVLGSLMHDGLKKTIGVSKKAVKNRKKKN